MNQQNDADVAAANAKTDAEAAKRAVGGVNNSAGTVVLDHLKERSHVWIIVPSVVIAGLYLWYAIANGVPEQLRVANLVLTVVATIAVVGGAIALVVMAMLKADDCGELKEFRPQLVLGLIVGVGLSLLQLLTLFGIAGIAVTG